MVATNFNVTAALKQVFFNQEQNPSWFLLTQLKEGGAPAREVYKRLMPYPARGGVKYSHMLYGCLT